jgi:hypothetical protein
LPVLGEATIAIPEGGARIVVRARDTGVARASMADRLVVEILTP